MSRLTSLLAFLGLLALPSLAWGQANEVISISDADHGAFTCTGGTCAMDNDTVDRTQVNGASVCSAVLHATLDPTEAGGTDDFASFADHAGSTTEGNEDEFRMPSSMTVVHSLRCDIDVAPGAGNDAWRIVVRDDGGDTSVTCDIDETATNCTDTSNSVGPAAASKLNLDISSEVSGDTDPTAAGELFCSVCLGH